MKKSRKLYSCLLLCMFFGCFAVFGGKAYAAEATVSFGSELYEVDNKEVFYIGLYISSEESLGDYMLTLAYNPEMLEYISGGDVVVGDEIVISGSSNEKRRKHMLSFKAATPGDTALEIRAINSNHEIEKLPTAPIHVRLAEKALLQNLVTGPVDIVGFAPEQLEYEITVENEVDKLVVQAEQQSEGSTVQVSDTKLKVGINTIIIAVTDAEGNFNHYKIYAKRNKQAAVVKTEEPVVTIDPLRPTEEITLQKRDIEIIVLIGAGIVAIISLFLILICNMIKRKKKKKRRINVRAVKTQEKQSLQQEKEDNVEISIQNVSMKFKVATSSVSGIKEYVIKAIKREITYREFVALNDVSFDVKKGEVVGLIGTNGSGKSTLLKILSGGLNPTSGKIIVDQKKVQLLSLGTGFDMELTARENVYLNGSIIGYSREFIDQKYDDIVEMAELDGFMEEKVKNFSSGMVSRLGFAIATIHDAPEILILDEVLSVGDLFFRRKSEERIQQMIHGGSTVIIVSHSTGVILKNCTKAVWLEKGNIRKMGDPKEVCAAYESMNNEKQKVAAK